MKTKEAPKEAQDTRIHWVIMDHLCRACGGRVLVSIANKGPTPGGNAIYRCADCGNQSTSMNGYMDVCWCGQEMKRNHHLPSKYMCLPFSILEEKPWLKTAFLSFGCDPARGDVGIMTRDEYQRLHDMAASLKDGGKLTFEFSSRPDAQAFLEWFGTTGSLAFSKFEREQKKKDVITRFDYSGAYESWGYDPEKHGLDLTVKAVPPEKK